MQNFLDKFKKKVEAEQKKAIESQPKYQVTQKIEKTLPVWTFDLSDEVDNDSLVKFLLEIKRNTKVNPNWSATRVLKAWSSDSFSARDECSKELEPFFKVVESKLEIINQIKYGKAKYYTGYKLDHYWFVIYNAGNSGIPHTHGTIDMATVYYCKTPENSAPLCITNGDSKIEIPVKEGLLVVFPGDVEHSVPISNHEGERVVIAMNFLLSELVPTSRRNGLIAPTFKFLK